MLKSLLHSLSFAGAFCAMTPLFANPETPSAEETSNAGSRDIEFSKKLNDVMLFDYSELFLKKALEANPGDSEALKIQLIETMALAGRYDDALAMAAQFTGDTAAQTKAYAAVGVVASKKGSYPIAIKALEKVLDYCKGNKDAQDSFKEPLLWLKQSYQSTGQADKAKKLADVLSEGQDPREAAIIKAITDLDTAQSMFEAEEANPDLAKPFLAARKKRLATFDGRDKLRTRLAAKDKGAIAQIQELRTVNFKDWQSIVIASIYDLEEVQWGGQDVPSAFSYPSVARALNMLKRYDDALEELEKVPDLMNACDDSFKQQKAIGQSPGAFNKYWIAETNYRKALETKDPAERLDCLKKAFKNYGGLLKGYPGFQLAHKAYGRFLKVCEELTAAEPQLASKIEALKKEVPVPQAAQNAAAVADEDIVPPQVDVAFKEKRYGEVVKGLLPVVRAKLSSSGLPDALYRLAVAYAFEKQYLEAMALCRYLADNFPKTQYTAVSLLQVADILWNANANPVKNETPAAAAARLKADEAAKADALYLYEVFLKVAPDHQFACEIAMRVAQEYYNRALAMGLAANKMPAGPKKIVATNEAVEAFKLAIPFYQRVVANFGYRKEWVEKAYYLLALSFTSARQFEDASNTYLRFCDSDPSDPTQLADAKLRAADALFQAGQDYEKQAREIRESAIELAEKQGAEGDSARAAKLAQAEKLDGKAAASYKEGITQARELLEQWLKEGGKLVAISNDPKVKKCVEDATQLIPWLYDADDEKQNAVDAFKIFITKYPNNKRVPACMMRMGVIYTEIDQPAEAERILSELSIRFKETPEGRNAKFHLARSLYNNQKYEKCVDIVGEILKDPKLRDNLSIQNLRWIAANLWDCGKRKNAKAAKLSLEAAEILLAKLVRPELKDWVGQQKAVELSANPKERKATIELFRQRTLCDAGEAAYAADLYQKAVEFYTEVLKDDRSACYFDAKFGRAEAYLKLKDIESAKGDLSEAALRANTSSRFALYDKAQCLLGDIAIEAKDYSKAFAAFNIVALMDTESKDSSQIAAYAKKKTDAERLEAERDAKAAVEWIEYAIYKTAYCASKLGKNEDKAKMVAKYKKSYPAGRFISEIDKLPAPEAANKP